MLVQEWDQNDQEMKWGPYLAKSLNAATNIHKSLNIGQNSVSLWDFSSNCIEKGILHWKRQDYVMSTWYRKGNESYWVQMFLRTPHMVFKIILLPATVTIDLNLQTIGRYVIAVRAKSRLRDTITQTWYYHVCVILCITSA